MERKVKELNEQKNEAETSKKVVETTTTTTHTTIINQQIIQPIYMMGQPPQYGVAPNYPG